MFCNYLHFPRLRRGEPTNNKGFSLIEVLVVIAIIGILSVIVYPNVMQSRSNAKTRAVASEIFSSFRSARIEAVKRNGNVCLDFNTDGTYEVFLDDGPGSCGQDGTETTLTSKQVQPGTTILAGFNAGFTSQGRPLNGTLGNVAIQNDMNTNLRYRSVLSIAGRVDLQVTTNGDLGVGATWK